MNITKTVMWHTLVIVHVEFKNHLSLNYEYT